MRHQSVSTPSSSVGTRRPFTTKAVLGVFALVGLACCGGVLWTAATSLLEELSELLIGAVMLAVALAAHALTTWWALTVRPHWTRWALTQAPYAVFYTMLYVWYFGGWTIGEGGPPSLWYLPWVGLAGIAMSWLWVWWLDYGERTNPRRAIAFLSLLGLMVAGNAAAGVSIAFQRTEGFGLGGPPTPQEAFYSLAATSCLFDIRLYVRGGKTTDPQCPDFTRHPAPAFDRYTSSDQPRQALNHWWEHYRQFPYLSVLQYRSPTVEHHDSSSATVRVTVNFTDDPGRFGRLSPEQRWCVTGPRHETWTLHLTPALAGGWKVERVDIAERMMVVPYIDSACDRG